MLAPAVRNRAARIDAVQTICWSVGLALRANLPAPEAHTVTKVQILGTVKEASLLDSRSAICDTYEY